jgi:hypothetical protein
MSEKEEGELNSDVESNPSQDIESGELNSSSSDINLANIYDDEEVNSMANDSTIFTEE